MDGEQLVEVDLVCGGAVHAGGNGGEHEVAELWSGRFGCAISRAMTETAAGGGGGGEGGDAQAGDGLVCGWEVGNDVKGSHGADLGEGDFVGVLDGEFGGTIGGGDVLDGQGVELEVGAALGEGCELLFFPGCKQCGIRGAETFFEGGDLFLELRNFWGFKHGFGLNLGAGVDTGVAVETDVIQAVEISEELEVVLLADGIKFVVVALGAAEGEAEHGFTKGFDAVGVVVGEVFLGYGAALMGDHVVALKTGGNELGFAGIREEVTGELIDQKLVVGLVVVKGLDDPIPPEPKVATAIDGEAVGVCVASGVQPVECQALAEVRTLQELIDEGFLGFEAGVRGKTLDRFGTGGQAGEVDVEAADELMGICWGAEGEVFLLEAFLDQGVDGMLVFGFDGGSLGWNEGPMIRVGCAVFDPGLNEFFLGFGELQMGFGRWHQFVGIRADDALPDFALAEVTGFDGGAAFDFRVGGFRDVQAEFGFAVVLIKAVTGETVFREDGADIPIVIRCCGLNECRHCAKEG